MTRAITILTENFADWETALINSTARLYYGFYTQFATPGGLPVTSSGGMLVTPQLALEEINLEELDLLMVCGGSHWQSGKAPDLGPLLRAARDKNVVLAGICDGTRVLAQAGVLDTVRHTSNSADNLAGTGYAGAALYQDVPWAVADQRIITAPGTAPVTFTREVLRALDIADDNLAAYLAMHGAEHGKTAP
ncbi:MULTISPECIES: type 1 glutamine amidotransferase family protein [unclassified Janthinobacterium]|uniref:type 1 glutamine amidotransferase family protein n=1 Tax=unclassified Janthinobacterium TaxID=2610881 RepID=UPI0025B48EC1|nr:MULTISPECIES: type 1 glutamine amidotransferase family protein [unclassified Janthinobacterium]MDN2671824.1 glutamine amidotransferase [Janthinobacterium sp. SUN026]MDN2700870.1 glutamine amidotransferase [Janthinobacterium sp. SUN100]MDO8039884.1 glutamine amidotransferase [Janthinobacterium sp. SUN137]